MAKLPTLASRIRGLLNNGVSTSKAIIEHLEQQGVEFKKNTVYGQVSTLKRELGLEPSATEKTREFVARKRNHNNDVAGALERRLVRQRVVECLGVKASDDVNTLRNVVRFLVEHNETDRIENHVILARLREGVPKITASRFYWYLKDCILSREDERVYLVYVDVLAKLGLAQSVSPEKFSQRGGMLLDYLREWLGGAGNEIEEVLLDYLDAVMSSSGGRFASTPKFVIGERGQEVWKQHVELKRGGRAQYLKPSADELAARERAEAKLDAVGAYRQSLLESGDVKGYDEVGRFISDHGLSAAYEKFCVGGENAREA